MNTASQPPQRWSQTWSPRVRRVARWAVAIWAGLVLLATAWVLLDRGHPESPRFAGAPVPGERADLARHDRGAVARASSAHGSAHHHAVFAIDGVASRDLMQKWVSFGADRAPWLEITLAGPADVDQVNVVHAGHAEHDAYTIHRYTVRCFDAAGAELASASVDDNRADIARHPLDCPNATRVRLDFRPDDRESNRGVVRIFEVEVMGTPR